MTENTSSAAPAPDTDPGTAAVSGGPADRMDSAGEGTGGLAPGGADGVTAAREELRKDLGERAGSLGEETGDDLEQAAAVGETDDPQGGSIQEHGSRP